MFKKFVLEMILTGIQKDLGTYMINTKDIEILQDISNDTCIYFRCSTIFESCHITGWIDFLGNVVLCENDEYRTIKAFYAE